MYVSKRKLNFIPNICPRRNKNADYRDNKTKGNKNQFRGIEVRPISWK